MTQQLQTDRLLRPRDAIRLVNMKKTTFYAYVKSGKLKPVYVGGLIRQSSLPCVEA